MRNCGWWPGSLGLAQWQLGFPQRRTLAVMEPGRKSPKLRNCSRSFARSSSKSGRDSGTRHSGILSLQCLRVKLLSEICPKKEKPAINYSYVVHPSCGDRLKETAISPARPVVEDWGHRDYGCDSRRPWSRRHVCGHRGAALISANLREEVLTDSHARLLRGHGTGPITATTNTSAF